MGRFAIIAIVMIVLAGFFHVMFVIMDYGYNNPETGAFRRVQNALNDTLSDSYASWVNNGTMKMRQFFGIGRVVVVGVCILACSLEILERRRETQG